MDGRTHIFIIVQYQGSCNHINLVYSFELRASILTHIYLAFFLWDVGKQCRPISDTKELLEMAITLK